MLLSLLSSLTYRATGSEAKIEYARAEMAVADSIRTFAEYVRSHPEYVSECSETSRIRKSNFAEYSDTCRLCVEVLENIFRFRHKLPNMRAARLLEIRRHREPVRADSEFCRISKEQLENKSSISRICRICEESEDLSK